MSEIKTEHGNRDWEKSINYKVILYHLNKGTFHYRSHITSSRAVLGCYLKKGHYLPITSLDLYLNLLSNDFKYCWTTLTFFC